MSGLITNDLRRFFDAQAEVYAQALAELKAGRKQTHWMWYIFPQLAGLGSSATAQYYAIANLEEARQYLRHPLLGARLRECCEVLLALPEGNISEILGYPDNLKLCSCMTLFELAADDADVFVCVLQKFFNGRRDSLTLELLEKSPT
jgi:uncharacterized protein (DUF1810 family)